MATVSACLKAVTCVPPSRLGMLFPNASSVSFIASVYCIAMSARMPLAASSRVTAITGLCTLLDALRWRTYPASPSAAWKVTSRIWPSASTRSSRRTMRTPGFRKLSSRRRCSRRSNWNVVSAKISWSGLKLMRVPVRPPDWRSATTCSGSVTSPREKAIFHVFAPLSTSTSVHSLRAFTHLMPTPCRPPDTL